MATEYTFLGMGNSSLDKLRHEIIQKAKTEEEAHSIAVSIAEKLINTNWKELLGAKEISQEMQREMYLNAKHTCERCKKKFKLREMRSTDVAWSKGLYCIKCIEHFQKEHTYTCPQCDKEYLSRRSSTLCTDCRIKDEKKELLVLQRHLREARNAGLPATLTLEQWLGTLQHFKGRCAYCEKQAYEVLEHFIPTSQRGGTTVDNCVPACKKCNDIKKRKLPEDVLLDYVTDSIMHTGIEHYFPINITSIKRVWTYLDSKRQEEVPGISFNEQKQLYEMRVSQWYSANKPRLRKQFMDLLGLEEKDVEV